MGIRERAFRLGAGLVRGWQPIAWIVATPLLGWGWLRPASRPTPLAAVLGTATILWVAVAARWAWSRRRRSWTPAWATRGWWVTLCSASVGGARGELTWLRATRSYAAMTRPRKSPLPAIWARARDYWVHPVLEENIIYRETDEWINEYKPSGGAEGTYSTALKFAERQYDQSLKLTESLDKKSDDVIRVSGVIAGVVAAVSKLGIVENALGSSPWIILPAACFTVSMMIAVRARSPADLSTPMDARTALEVVELRTSDPQASEPVPTPGYVVEGAMAASYNFAAIGMTIINIWKARQLERSSNCFIAGLVILLIQVVASRLNW